MQPVAHSINKRESAGAMLRTWRKLHRISQLDLALEVGISSRHLSFVETGRSQPSRSLVLRIAHSLKLPLRHRNAFLKAAGYASEFGEAPFDGEKMDVIRQALRRILENHEPYPAFVVDPAYNFIMKNSSFERILKFFIGEKAFKQYDNAYRMTFAEDGLRPYIQDWPTIAQFMLTRLWEEAVSTQNARLMALYAEISPSREPRAPLPALMPMEPHLPIMSLTLVKHSIKASLFTTITTFGTPLDVTAQELRIESFFPADEETKQMLWWDPCATETAPVRERRGRGSAPIR